MAKLKIYTFPDTVLTQKVLPIPRVEKGLWKLADDMLETMYDAPGIGLAANQVGLLNRIIVVDTDFDLEELPKGAPPPDGAEVGPNGSLLKNKNPQVMINPEIVFREGTQKMSEGCLSVPQYNAEVVRASKIKLQYLDLDGLTRTLDAEGLMAVLCPT